MDTNEILRRLEPLIPEQVARWRSILNLADHETISLVERQIRIVARKRLGADYDRRLFLSLPSQEQSKGPFKLGTIVYETTKWPFGISTGELLQNVSIFGRSGAGKTNVVFQLLQQLSRKNVKFLFLDYKRTARHLVPYLNSGVQIFTPGRSLSPFAFNPLLLPPGVEREAYLIHIIDLLAQAYTLGDGAKSLLHKALLACFDRYDVPTFREVLQSLDDIETKERSSGWKISARRALESVVSVETVRDSDQQAELARNILQKSTIIELDALSANYKKFLIPLLCYWIFSVQIAQPTREQLQYVIAFEEAHHILYRQEQRHTESLMNQLLRQGRELGIGCLVVDQHPHLISASALGNCYTSIFLNLKDTSDLSKAAGLASLKDSQRNLFNHLPVGEGVIKLQDRFTQPFLVRFPLHPLTKGAVTDAMLGQVFRGKLTWSDIRERLEGDSRVNRHSRLGVTPVEPRAVSLLHDIVTFPHDGVDARYHRLGVSISQGHRLKQQLLENRLVTAERVKVGRTYRVALRLTDAAKRMLVYGPGRDPQASFLHEYWKRRIADEYEARGYLVTLESARRSTRGRMDILLRRESESVAVEIESGQSDVVSNVKRDLLERVSRVLIVAIDQSALRTVVGQLAKAGLLLPGRVLVSLQDEALE